MIQASDFDDEKTAMTLIKSVYKKQDEFLTKRFETLAQFKEALEEPTSRGSGNSAIKMTAAGEVPSSSTKDTMVMMMMMKSNDDDEELLMQFDKDIAALDVASSGTRNLKAPLISMLRESIEQIQHNLESIRQQDAAPKLGSDTRYGSQLIGSIMHLNNNFRQALSFIQQEASTFASVPLSCGPLAEIANNKTEELKNQMYISLSCLNQFNWRSPLHLQ